jgi:hypothetical protein
VANQVTDNRTNISTGESATNWEDIAGTALAVDTEIRYDTYTGSIGQYVTTTRDATMYNNTTTGLFTSGDHAYLLVNCGVVSLLDTKVNGGLTVRATGATATDWAEFELFGSDEWPTTFDGGWAQIVVDIDELLANPTNTNGTPPTVGNIQRFGVTYITATVMPRMTDNIWVGGFKRLPANTPGLIIEGRDSGTTDWAFGTVAAVAAVQLSATLKPGPAGSFVCRTPIQIGINDTSTHAFTETNPLLLWDFQEVMLDGFYKLNALGNSGGTTNITFGVKTGTGADATGSQGGAIQASSTGARWDIDFNDPNIDGVNFYGASLVHGGDFLLDDIANSFISTLYIDCTSALVDNSEQLRVSSIDANSADAAAFMTVDDLSDIANSTFNFSDGHAIEIDVAGTYTFSGNIFAGAFGGTPGSNLTPSSGSNDAMILNSSGGLVTINIAGGGDTPSIRNTAVSTTQVNNDVTLTFVGAVNNSEIRVYTTGTQTELGAGIEDSDGTDAISVAGGTAVDLVIHHPNYEQIRLVNFTWPSTDADFIVSQRLDRNFSNP